MADGPLGRARQRLLDAKAAQALKDTPRARDEVASARVHLDYLLDTLPLVSSPSPTPTPDGPGASHPGPSVSLFTVGGEHWEDQECTPTTQQDTDSEDD